MKQIKKTAAPLGIQSGLRVCGGLQSTQHTGTHAELLHEKEGIFWNQDQHSASENQGSQPGNTATRRATEMECDICDGLSGTLMSMEQTAKLASMPTTRDGCVSLRTSQGNQNNLGDIHRKSKMANWA